QRQHDGKWIWMGALQTQIDAHRRSLRPDEADRNVRSRTGLGVRRAASSTPAPTEASTCNWVRWVEHFLVGAFSMSSWSLARRRTARRRGPIRGMEAAAGASMVTRAPLATRAMGRADRARPAAMATGAIWTTAPVEAGSTPPSTR